MEKTVRSGERRAYASAVTDLWERLAVALGRLERIAESPAEWRPDELLDELPGLQYHLHAAAELAVGISPPKGAESVHAELVAALAHARDATAEIALALEGAEGESAEAFLPEWRGALFRVRLARLRALERTTVAIAADEPASRPYEEARATRAAVSAVVATAFVVAGALLFTAGAVLAAWPLWAAGLLLFAGGFVLYRP